MLHGMVKPEAGFARGHFRDSVPIVKLKTSLEEAGGRWDPDNSNMIASGSFG
jgi:hypothetical protein